ncbi:M23 family metallopeptidase [Myxococcus sp. CA051A]|uniref:peptidoglycan DD-metalloendopeptidase family protein n=1 Tax=unclassified Myxococcus TaxID=2648731 RepID=UPI00157A4652|nr:MULTISPECIES: M23 family metallopeptidase [unclassified Myxococcus]NTX14608.1 M23 family metallopeptidase [Myxococcus sp. CA056]NTX57446.1 M23 family metallopeptidase [Myxococcus sp. CA039A]NTX62703.1 M23 family metallopeptidase [Myxococcus sp. CA051A]
MRPGTPIRAGRALLVLLVSALVAGCVGPRAASPGTELTLVDSDAPAPSGETRGAPAAASPEPAPPPRNGALPFALRAAHPEPELVSVRHRVAPGETMYRIAKTYGLTVDELSSANGIKDVRALAVGQELTIPGVERSVPVESSDTLAAEADPEPVRTSTGAAPRQVVARREEPPRRPASRPGAGRPRLATQGMIDWPLRGVLYGRFGKKGREPHDGIDLAAPAGTPVKTAQEGTVLYAGEQRGYGNIVIVEHANRLITLYAHNRDLRVRTGQKVRREQVIATVGESGKTSGPHLHFELRLDGKPVDPLDYLGPMPST